MTAPIAEKKVVQRGESTSRAKAGGKNFEATVADLIRPDKEMEYVSLHHHSTYSYLDGFALPSAHVRRAAELGMPALALTEHGNVSSHAKLETAAAEFGVQPIFGCELYCGAVDDNRTQRKNHLTVLAETDEGYKNLLRVVSQGWSDYYYEPTVSGDALARYKQGLIILSGCTGSLLATSLIGGKNVPEEEASYARARNVARRFKKVFGDSYYLEVQMFPELEKVKTINEAYERMSRELGIPLVATGDCHYTIPEEAEMQVILHNVRPGKRQTVEQQMQNWGYDVPLCPPLTDRVAYEKLRATGLSHRAAEESIKNTLVIAGRCKATIPHMEPVQFPVPDGYETADDVWTDWLRQGWHYRGFDKLTGEESQRYIKRLNREIKIILDKDFRDYFLCVSDIVKYAKDNGVLVGPARGSAAASLVCYVLRITEVNPMLFPNMMFERFLDETREDLPDIDLDFDDEERWRVFEYAAQRYGRDKVGKIGTFTNYKSKNSLDDVGLVFKVPKGKVETVKELLLDRSSGDLRASATIEDTVASFDAAREVFEQYPDMNKAMRLEGNVKGMSVHAAGLVVASRPITDVCAVYTKPDGKGGIKLDNDGLPMQVVSFDKYDAETHNLLKMDILGLANLALLRICLGYIGKDFDWLYSIDLEDPETIRGFQENDCIGIFQFDGWAMRSVNGSLMPDNFDEVAVVNALARPGPLHSNASAEYVEVKSGLKEPTLTHPLLDPIVASTRGQIVYQEQILRIVREIGDFSWTHAAYIRKIISRKLGEQEFNRQKETFRDGARKKGLDDETIDRIWGACITAGGYAFNVPHCVSYGMLGFWTMYLKRHHPVEFFTAAFRKLADWKTLSLLRDAHRHGIDVLPPSLNESLVTWSPEGESGIRAGFEQIPGIGEKTAKAIIEAREAKPFERWKDLQRAKGVGPKTIDSIVEFCERDDPFEIHKLTRAIETTKEWIRTEATELPYPTHTTMDIPMDRGEDVEVVWIGTVHSRNLRDLEEVNFGKTGEPLDLSTVRRPDLLEWVIMYGEDDTEQMSITIDRFRYPKFRKQVWGIELDEDLVLVRGVKKGYQSRRALYVWDMWVIAP